ncbi:arsenate reductase ArsC [Desulfococcaceae bacterium OttesenSCG-928-F15]|nr:arsenate reductase ArsC [Desulfococcaceae bacterium OttesenSCG-928-F15]
MNILFLSPENSCRSIMAEALCKFMSPGGLEIDSAGSRPSGIIHPKALITLNKNGLPTDNLCSKSWDKLRMKPDVVIALCLESSENACPIFWENPMRTQWDIPDPTQIEGDEEAVDAAFDDTFTLLKRHISLLVALPLLDLQATPSKLENMLIRIAAL